MMKLNSLNLAGKECKNKEFYAIDLFKFLFSIAIISLHYPPGIIVNNVVLNLINQYFARLAVPFFFIASGYFLFKKIKYEQDKEKQIEILKKYLKKILKMYIIWSIINLPLAIKYYKDKEISYVIQRIFLVGSYRQFWFLWALLIDIPIVYFLNKKISPKLTMLIGSVLYLIGTVGLEFYKVVMELSVLSIFYKCIFDFFITTRNAIFLGFVFVAIGNYFANCKNNLTIIKVYTVFVLTSITIFLENIVFTKFSYKNLGDMRISLLPLVFCLFYLVSHIDLKNRKIYILLRNMSMYIYCSHCILAEGINLIFKVNLTLGQQYICGVVFSILFSYMMVKIKQIQKNKLVTNKI